MENLKITWIKSLNINNYTIGHRLVSSLRSCVPKILSGFRRTFNVALVVYKKLEFSKDFKLFEMTCMVFFFSKKKKKSFRSVLPIYCKKYPTVLFKDFFVGVFQLKAILRIHCPFVREISDQMYK